MLQCVSVKGETGQAIDTLQVPWLVCVASLNGRELGVGLCFQEDQMALLLEQCVAPFDAVAHLLEEVRSCAGCSRLAVGALCEPAGGSKAPLDRHEYLGRVVLSLQPHVFDALHASHLVPQFKSGHFALGDGTDLDCATCPHAAHPGLARPVQGIGAIRQERCRRFCRVESRQAEGREECPPCPSCCSDLLGYRHKASKRPRQLGTVVVVGVIVSIDVAAAQQFGAHPLEPRWSVWRLRDIAADAPPPPYCAVCACAGEPPETLRVQ